MSNEESQMQKDANAQEDPQYSLVLPTEYDQEEQLFQDDPGTRITLEVNRLYLWMERRDLIQLQRQSELQAQRLLFFVIVSFILIAFVWREYMLPGVVMPLMQIIEALKVVNEKLDVMKTNSFFK